jgi:hypothetical protein
VHGRWSSGRTGVGAELQPPLMAWAPSSLSLAGCRGSPCQTGSGKEVGDDGNFLMIRCSAF